VGFLDGTIDFPEWGKWYIPRNVMRVKPLNPYKFYQRYGFYAVTIRKMGLLVEETLRIIHGRALKGKIGKAFVNRARGRGV
jgi:molybdate-binding protein